MTLFHKNVHSFLPFSNPKDNGIVEKSLLFSPLFSTVDTTMKRVPGGIGFLDDVGGSVDGLMSCTESLGFESSDEKRVDLDDQIDSLNYEMCHSNNSRKESMFSSGNSRWKGKNVKREVKKFPPPLSSLDQNGKPTFFLRPVRKDGKLELQEVKINSRPEILCASREGGRLKLHFICNEDEDFEEEEEEEIMKEVIETEVEGEEEGLEEYIEEEEEEEWEIPASPGGGGGDGFRRCYEEVRHHRNHHVWNQHCVTIR